MKNNPLTWDLKLLYRTPQDPKIEDDALQFERLISDFADKYDREEKTYLSDDKRLVEAIVDYEKILSKTPPKPLIYFLYLRDIDATNERASSAIPLFTERFTKAENKAKFFEISLGRIQPERQKALLKKPGLEKYRVFLERVFFDARFSLSVPEEKIMSLKSQPAYDMWIAQNERILNMKTVSWKGKELALAEALNKVQSLWTAGERGRLSKEISKVLKEVAPFSEGEINAVITNKRINDDLRGYSTPFENTVNIYRNDPKVVENMVKVVTGHFSVARRFYKLKAKLLKQKRLNYCDRSAKIGIIKSKFAFSDSLERLRRTVSVMGRKYRDILDSYVKNSQIDVFPKSGKKSGAYCWGTYDNPTLVLLNHVDDLHSFTTFAHEMGHAFHTELSKTQGPIYHDYSTALAETASTLFESLALEAVSEDLSKEERIIMLHDKINDDVSTIFRQIACFNFELDLHRSIRKYGFLSTEAIIAKHNEHMASYLGPIFKLDHDDGYMFVQWSHIRRFFYVYSYSYGMLVSKAMLRRYHEDRSYWKKIEQFLSAGGRDSPENILREIGIDVSKPDFWLEGIKEIEKDISELENLASVK